MLFSVFACEHDDDLTTRFCFLEMSDDLFESAPDVFFMYLGDLLATLTCLSVPNTSANCLRVLSKRYGDS